MFLGQFRPRFTQPEEKEEPETTQKPPEAQKSSSPEEFLGTQKAQEFISRWSKKTRDGSPLYTKRGITALLRALFGSFDTDKDVLESADEILNMLGGMDGLQGFLAGWKAKSEGLIKGLKSIVGGSGE
ncbi:hypothetical protein GF318_04280 [Candidatus Micrarchaeota archaeon]|nr:hypothetical protein [Candidatus Micrarchaeota archaeon]